MVCFQSTPTSVGRSLWIRSYGNRNCCKRATVRLGIDTLIANILVNSSSMRFTHLFKLYGPGVLSDHRHLEGTERWNKVNMLYKH